MVIVSAQNKQVQYFESLKFPKNQKIEGKYFIESDHLIREALRYGLLETLMVCESVEDQYHFNGEILVIADHVSQKLSMLKNPSKVFGIVKIKKSTNDFKTNILVLDDIQDPGNMGTLIRSACAFGFDTIFSSVGSANYYNPKTLRSAQGNHFMLNLVTGDIIELLEKIKSTHQIVTTFLNKPNNIEKLKNNKVALVLGNEGNGIRSDIEKYSNVNYLINIKEEVESLNVAISGSILMEKIFNK